jgi:dihydrofolate reductase
MINLIVACDQNRVIGKNGKLPWSIQEDWDYFMRTTAGGSMIMGKICYQEFEPHAKDRDLIAMTKDRDYRFPYAKTAHSMQHALSLANHDPIWICGGEAIYREAFPLADSLYLTLIDDTFEGDVYFPEWKHTFQRLISRQTITKDGTKLEFLILEKG